MAKRKYFGEKNKSELSEFEKDSIKGYKARFSFWHNKQIDALTFTINLLFTISIALTGFIITNQEKELFKETYLCGQYSMVRTSLLILAISASLGVVALIARLNDLRTTKNIVKKRRRIFELNRKIKYEDLEPSDKEFQISERDSLIRWATIFGKATWILFYIQLGLFMLTIWIIVLSV